MIDAKSPSGETQLTMQLTPPMRAASVAGKTPARGATSSKCDEPETETENDGGNVDARALAVAAMRDTAATADEQAVRLFELHSTRN